MVTPGQRLADKLDNRTVLKKFIKRAGATQPAAIFAVAIMLDGSQEYILRGDALTVGVTLEAFAKSIAVALDAAEATLPPGTPEAGDVGQPGATAVPLEPSGAQEAT